MIGRAVGFLLGIDARGLEASLPGASCGMSVAIANASGRYDASVTEVRGDRVRLLAATPVSGLAVGDLVIADPVAGLGRVGTVALGRALDAYGRPIDGDGPLGGGVRRPLAGRVIVPSERVAISVACVTGIRVVDGLLAFGRGARIGIFGAPGAGKSTLLASFARASDADAVVVGLIGERGREAQQWIQARPAHSSIVCATADREPGERLRAVEFAFAQAEALRDRGLHVLLIIDSLARVAAAARDLAVRAGEPVGRAGYPASVVTRQARLLERAGAFNGGSITLVATVLTDGSLSDDPIADAARAALDGHIVLCPRRAAAGRFPAVDVGASVSRTFADVASPAQRRAAAVVRALLYRLEESRDMRAAGLDPAGNDPDLATAVACEPALERWLCQGDEPSSWAQTQASLASLARDSVEAPIRFPERSVEKE